MIIDVMILILLAIAIFIGRVRGLNSCIISILSLFLAIILAILLCRPLGNFIIENTNIDEGIKNAIKENIHLDKFEIRGLENYPEQIKEYIGNAVEGVNSAGEMAMDNISTQLSIQIIYVISYIIILIATKIVLWIIKMLSKVIEKIPVLKQINDIGGAICGLCEGALLIYMVIAIISICSPMMKDSWLISEMNQSYVGKVIYNNNIFANNIIKFN